VFVDSSALVAIIAREPDYLEFIQTLGSTRNCTTSPLVVLETTMRLSTLLQVEPLDVLASLYSLLDQFDVTVVAIEPADGEAAVRAFADYGKGRGTKARLNLADCLTYACAKNRALPILYKGTNFAATDLF
jgi:ribonuclease VapC